MSSRIGQQANGNPPSSTGRAVAVVDIGSTSIRMAIAEIEGHGLVRTIEEVSRAVSLGKDTFTSQEISRPSIEECVRILRSYRRLMQEYGITRPDQIRLVATSAVREASNRLAFLDRIYIATGLEVKILDEAEVNRITYMGIQPLMQANPILASVKTIVVEVGSGSTEILVVSAGNIQFSNTYRLGSLRMLEQVDRFKTSHSKQRAILETQIRRIVHQISENVGETQIQMVAIGGDVRMAVKNIDSVVAEGEMHRVSADALLAFARQIGNLHEDQLVSRYSMSFADTETLWPALMSYALLAKEFKSEQLFVADTNLRDGLLTELSVRDAWTVELRNQIVLSAINLGRRFAFDESHARHVATLCRKLFLDLMQEHQLDQRMELILYLAALLHEIGTFISSRSHHKHAMYIIRHSELFGLSERDQLLLSLVVRYQRRSSPQPEHEGYSILDRNDRIAVAKMAAMLRLAIALDESRSERIGTIRCLKEDNRLVIITRGSEDVSLEQLTIRQSGDLFEEVFGLSVALRNELE
ncbi:MAG: Exopolyphosphatase [Planctomycetota bacterium]|jgi:exopolyphosphatase / guanosine-5'-triphosphate,3'-diphosphate pyrophosphatase